MLDDGLTDAERPLWLAYAITLGSARSQSVEAHGAPRFYAEELAALRAMVEVIDAAAPPSPFAAALARVAAAGYLPDYALVMRGHPSWRLTPAEAAALRPAAFRAWYLDALPEHVPQHGAAIEHRGVGDKTTPPGAETHVAISRFAFSADACGTLGPTLEQITADWSTERAAIDAVVLAPESRIELLDSLARPEVTAAIAERGLVWANNAPAVARLMAGFCAVEARDPDRAEQHYRAALALQPQSWLAAVQLTHVFAMTGRWEDILTETAALMPLAESACRKALLMRKQGYALVELHRLADARARYIESLTVMPGHPIALKRSRASTPRSAGGGRRRPRSTRRCWCRWRPRSPAAPRCPGLRCQSGCGGRSRRCRRCSSTCLWHDFVVAPGLDDLDAPPPYRHSRPGHLVSSRCGRAARCGMVAPHRCRGAHALRRPHPPVAARPARARRRPHRVRRDPADPARRDRAGSSARGATRRR
ncbi:MAG: hypothetical protein R3F65_19690 [bacterium]